LLLGHLACDSDSRLSLDLVDAGRSGAMGRACGRGKISKVFDAPRALTNVPLKWLAWASRAMSARLVEPRCRHKPRKAAVIEDERKPPIGMQASDGEKPEAQGAKHPTEQGHPRRVLPPENGYPHRHPIQSRNVQEERKEEPTSSPRRCVVDCIHLRYRNVPESAGCPTSARQISEKRKLAITVCVSQKHSGHKRRAR
jgi:hypothetical protein